MANFNNACNGGDFGDWATGAKAQVQDAFTEPGVTPIYGVEVAALSAIGHQVVPEPATWSLLLGASAAALSARRRKANR